MALAEIEEDLKASYHNYGPMRTVLVSKKFGVIAGETRLRAVPEWPKVVMEELDQERAKDGKSPRAPKTKFEFLCMKAADNVHAVKDAPWWERIVNEAAEELKNTGTKPGAISTTLIGKFPLSKTRLMGYLHQEFKEPGKVGAGQKGGRPAREEESGSVAEPETSQKESETPKYSKESLTIKEETRPGAPRDVPYHGTPPSLKTNLVGEFTPSQLSLIGGLQYLHVPYRAEFRVPVRRWECQKCRDEYDEGALPIFDKEAGGYRCRNDGQVLEQETRKVDVLVEVAGKKIAIEAEGKGTSSDDPERDALLKEQDVLVFHAPNKFLDEWSEKLAEFIALVQFNGGEKSKVKTRFLRVEEKRKG